MLEMISASGGIAFFAAYPIVFKELAADDVLGFVLMNHPQRTLSSSGTAWEAS